MLLQLLRRSRTRHYFERNGFEMDPVFRQGDVGTNWYAVLSGSLDMNVSETGDSKDAVTLCTLGTGTAFGESILNDTPRHSTVVTKEYCELLRVEQRDFKILWERNKKMIDSVLNPCNSSSSAIIDSAYHRRSDNSMALVVHTGKYTESDDGDPAAPITQSPSEKILHAGKLLHAIIQSRAPFMICDRKHHLRLYRKCLIGSEMVDWLTKFSSVVRSRMQAVGIWQVLVEEGVLMHVCREHPFKDGFLFYRFLEDEQVTSTSPALLDRKQWDDDLFNTLTMLSQTGPDAMLRMILRKTPCDRTSQDLEIIYEELLHIKALSHLSTMVKRELASVMIFEAHSKAGKILFNQGEEGKSWYIIMKGSVNVVIFGKGIVCTLHEGDDFGKLALVNDSPRAATIVLREDNCYFLRVDKDDFNRILRDVEANTVRLKEHGQDVLVLEKIPANIQTPNGSVQVHYKYSVMAGTPDKILEHLLETRTGKSCEATDSFCEDFLLTYIIFMPNNHLCPTLMAHYHADVSIGGSGIDSPVHAMVNKHQVIHFVWEWCQTVGDAFWEDRTVLAFLEELENAVAEDQQVYENLENTILQNVLQRRHSVIRTSRHGKSHSPLQGLSVSRSGSLEEEDEDYRRQPIRFNDLNIFKIYCADHTYVTLKLRMDTTVDGIIKHASSKLGLGDVNLTLCEVKSNGERVTFNESDLCITSGMSINGRLFITPQEHLDALTPLPEQEGPSAGTSQFLEVLSSREVAYHMSYYDWQLLNCIHEYELIYLVFGRASFGHITANLDLFLRRFNEIQFWIVTEMCLTHSISKRVQLLRKFIKIAVYCKNYQNMNSFFAIVMGLSNIAVSRLSQTWEKLPNKFRKMFADFEMMMDPSRNHRVYRLAVMKMQPPIIPFMPLLMKDMTFTHEGNKTHFDGLVNFEKMHMIAESLRTLKICRSKPFEYDPPPLMKTTQLVKDYIRLSI